MMVDSIAATRPDIFLFDNVKDYLKRWFDWKKSVDKNYSYRAFSAEIGYSSPNQLMLIIQGKRNITDQAVADYARVLGLKKREHDFFATLVHFNQSETMIEKRGYMTALAQIKSHGRRLLSDAQYEYLTKWYHVAIREMVNLHDFNESSEWISERLGRLISPQQAQHALHTLVELNLIARNDEGKLVQTSNYFSTGNEVAHVAAFSFHEQTMNLARTALDSLDHERRNMSSLTFTIRKKDYSSIVQRIGEMRQAIIRDLNSRDAQTCDEDLYQLNIHFFPLTREIK